MTMTMMTMMMIAYRKRVDRTAISDQRSVLAVEEETRSSLTNQLNTATERFDPYKYY